MIIISRAFLVPGHEWLCRCWDLKLLSFYDEGNNYKLSFYIKTYHCTCRMTHIEGEICGIIGTMDQTLGTGKLTDSQRGQVLGPVSTLTNPAPGKWSKSKTDIVNHIFLL